MSKNPPATKKGKRDTRSHRPRIGRRVIQGLEVLHVEVSNSFILNWLDKEDAKDAECALRYMSRLAYWYTRGRHLKGENVVDIAGEAS